MLLIAETRPRIASGVSSCINVPRINMLMPRAFYRDALEQGTMDDGDLAAALAGAPRGWRLPPSVDQLRRAIDVEAPLGTGAKATGVHPGMCCAVYELERVCVAPWFP